MIYTLTLNPSVDLHLSLDKFKVGEINRSTSTSYFPGGKGINVSRMLRTLGMPSTALGFIGSYSGDYIEDSLKKEGIKTEFTRIKDATRINVKLDYKKETAVNSIAPKISKEEINSLIFKLYKLKKNDILICSGALPKSISIEIFKKMLNSLNNNNVKIVIDMSGDSLKEAIKHKPLLIKPNKEELEELFSSKINNEKDVIKLAKKAILLGVNLVLVSLGKDGAILVSKDNVYKTNAIKGKVISTVGAGDSMLAGFIYKYIKSNNLEESLKYSSVVGSATAFSKDLAKLIYINKLLKMLQ